MSIVQGLTLSTPSLVSFKIKDIKPGMNEGDPKRNNFKACRVHNAINESLGAAHLSQLRCINNKLKYNTRDKIHYITHILTFSIF